MPDGSFSPEREGVAGMWLKEVRDGKVVASVIPVEGGKLDELLTPAKDVIQDPNLEAERKANPLPAGP